MLCHAATTDAEEGVASGLDCYSETWYCHMCCCSCCVGMSCYSCFIIIGEELATGRPTRGPYPGLYMYRGIYKQQVNPEMRNAIDQIQRSKGWGGVTLQASDRSSGSSRARVKIQCWKIRLTVTSKSCG